MGWMGEHLAGGGEGERKGGGAGRERGGKTAEKRSGFSGRSTESGLERVLTANKLTRYFPFTFHLTSFVRFTTGTCLRICL